MTSRKTFRWIGLLILFSALSVGAWYKRFSVVSADDAKSANESAVVSPVSSAMDANDLLVLRFDNSLNGENGETPTTATGTSFQTGVQNQGVLLPNPNQLFYSSANNINATEGTIEWWMKPTWNGNDAQGHFILEYGGGGGIVIGKDGANNMRIILNRFGAAPGGETGASFNVGSWTANQWHHVAFTWSNTSKQIMVYSDGTLVGQNTFTLNLPAINSTTFQVGGDGGGSYIESVVDNLRISNVARSSQEIANRMLEGLTVNGWSLNPATTAVELWPTWYWWITPTITANTNVGTLVLPVSAVGWTSSNPSVAIFETSSGRFKAIAPGSAVLTGTLGNAQTSFTINVVNPALPPVDEPIDSFLATPAAGYLHRMPVVIIRYFPTRDGVNLDAAATGITSTLAALKANTEQIERRHKFMLEEGSRFRGYGNAAAQPALGYQVIKVITVYEEVPPGFDAGDGAYFPDYNQILTRFGGANFVNNLGVKEFWIVQQHHGRVGINESNMSSPTTGDISNSFRTNGDQPIYNKTYVTYGINFTRSQAEATHNHGHQLESILSHVNQLRDGNTTLWWQQFARAANNPPARCGNTHFPPNATQDYDYTNLNPVASDILNWQPSGGPTTLVNANTWGNVPYAWPGGTAPPQEVESKWYIFWMQSMAGRGSAIPYNSNRLTNWWQFTADWDAAIQGGLGLHEPGSCSYALSATSQNVPLGGGTFTVNVTGGAGCKWIASSNETWASIADGSFGDGNGTVTFTVPAAGAARSGTLAIANQLFTINQTGGGCPTITVNPNPASVQSGAVGTPYSLTFSASGGTAPYTYSLLVGVLPLGLTLNATTGALTGTPTGGGSYSFTIRALDANNCTGASVYTVVISGPCGFALSPTNATFPAAGDGGFVSVTTANACAWTAVSNDAWITIDFGASGTGVGQVAYLVEANPGPSRAGTMTIAGQTFTVSQNDGCPTISVSPTNTSLPGATVGAAYSQTFTQTGGTGTINFTISAGALPAGLALNATTGVLSGTPSSAGTFSFTVRATDVNNCVGERAYTLTVASGNCVAVSISNSLTGGTGAGLTVPVMAGNLTGRGVVAYDLTLMFDPSILSLQTPVFDSAGTLSSGMTITPNTGTPGKLTISAFGVSALSGAGILLNLKFNIIGGAGACSDLMLTAFQFNEGTPCAVVTNGRVCVSNSIAGVVSYCITPASKVAGVTISANSASPVTGTTNSAGNYLLNGLGGGAVTVTATKSGDVNGISSFDASLVAQHVAGLATLTSCQQSAGDASNNGGLASFDASLIAQFAAGIDNQTSAVGTWKFVPPNRSYPNVSGNLTGQNYDAVLVGDVSGNWMPVGNGPVTPRVQIPISLPNLSVATGAGLMVPVTVGNLTGLGVTAYDFDLTFDPTILQPQNSPVDATGTLSSGMTITPNPMTSRLRVSAFGISPLAGAGTLLNLKFNVVGTPNSTTALAWQSFMLNEDAQNNLGNGNVTVLSASNGLQFYPLPRPVRLLETRAGFNGCTTPGAPINANGTLTLPAATNCAGIPANAQAVTGNITVVPQGAGFLTLFPSSAQQPTVANSNFANGEITNNVFTVGLGTGDGAFKIFTSAPTHVIVDVTGYYAPPAAGGLYFHPLSSPVRLLETRAGLNGCIAPGAPLTGTGDPNADPNQDFPVLGRSPVVSPCNSIPASAQVLVGNATSVFPSGGGYLTIYPSGGARPTVASSNYAGNDVVNGPFAVKLGADGKFKIYTWATTHLVVDILGYYSEEATDANGAGLLFNPLPEPVRLLETRLGGPPLVGCTRTNAPIQGDVNAATHTQPARGFCGLPTSVQALVGNVSVVNSAGAGFLTLFPGNLAGVPLVATSNYPAPATFGYNRHFFVGLSPADGSFKALTQFTTDLIVDVSGFFAP